MTDRTGFHAHSGWYFRRNGDATVTIYADATEDGHPREVTFRAGHLGVDRRVGVVGGVRRRPPTERRWRYTPGSRCDRA